MQSLNPIFVQGTALKKTFKPAIERATRSDKQQDIKYPVTPEQRQDLRRRAYAARMGDKQTKYNTNLLLRALQEPERAEPIEYSDSGQYMHVKPTQLPHDQIVELSHKWGLSKRQTVHRLMISALGRFPR